jgi:hypothetical protein
MAVDLMSPTLVTTTQEQALLRLLSALLDQEKATVLVSVQQASYGFWFGGGNLIETPDGTIWLCGRYRNFGDSRTGLGAGQRGLECTIFRSDDKGKTFQKTSAFTKADLSYGGREVVSIEGTALHLQSDGSVELFISSEKKMNYPQGLGEYQKPGTGVWTIDRMSGNSVDSLSVSTLEPVLENLTKPEYLHVKDPVVYDGVDGHTGILFCSHPFTWASSNTGLVTRDIGATQFTDVNWEVVGRGAAWDVAATRITERMAIPQLGVFAGEFDRFVYFYDGAECLRQLDENSNSNTRPRGYSCEELGGAFVGTADPTNSLTRLSLNAPLFISPYGTGCSRYVSILVMKDGILATWQQSKPDESQPLVGHFLPIEEVERLLQAE